MTCFSVPEMSCGHCTSAIEISIRAIDPDAKVACDLESRTVAVESGASEAALLTAVRDAGYAATPAVA